MRVRQLFLFLFILSVAFACRKKESQETSCSNQVVHSFGKQLLPPHHLDTTHHLFDKNQLDYTHFQFRSFSIYSLGGYNVNVRGNRFANGLKVFIGDMVANFDENGVLWSFGGDTTAIHLDAIFTRTKAELENRYKTLIFKDEDLSNTSEILNGCLDMEPGYYDINASSGRPAEFVKAWEVTPLGFGSKSPVAYISEATLEVLSYDNGIRF